MDPESIPLTAFTVGPLGFYECVKMLFGLRNAPAMFQRFMEACLGDLHLNWCIIYLDDVATTLGLLRNIWNDLMLFLLKLERQV